jgi:hypothetical protein
MICSILGDGDILYYRNSLFEIAENIGVESSCLILDMWDKKLTAVYKKFRSLLKLSRKYGIHRFEKAAERANFYNQQTITAIKIILQNKLDYLALDPHTDIWGQYRLDF